MSDSGEGVSFLGKEGPLIIIKTTLAGGCQSRPSLLLTSLFQIASHDDLPL